MLCLVLQFAWRFASSARRRFRRQGHRRARDRRQRGDALDPDRLNDLHAGRDNKRIGKQRRTRRLRDNGGSRRPAAVRDVDRNQRESDDQPKAGSSQAGIENAVTIHHENERGGTELTKCRRSRQTDGAAEGDQTQFRSGGPPSIADDTLEHHRRHVTPIRNPSPSASATVDSGRSTMTSCKVSPIEEAAVPAAALTRSEASAAMESTFARAFFRPRLAWVRATAPRSLAASAICCERLPMAFFMAVISLSSRVSVSSFAMPCVVSRGASVVIGGSGRNYDPWQRAVQGLIQCSSSTYRRSFRISATIKMGDERTAPIGPHSHVQNAKERSTASALSSSWRPMIVGVTNCPSTTISSAKPAAGSSP